MKLPIINILIDIIFGIIMIGLWIAGFHTAVIVIIVIDLTLISVFKRLENYLKRPWV